MEQKNILIIAGEPSGDLHASNLVKEIKTLRPDTGFSGIGGELCRKAGVDIIFDISELALVGVIEVLKSLFVVKKAYDAVMSKLDSSHIDLAILVDYPGFNLKLAKELKKRNIPVVYYISPQVWAWGAGRINTMKKCVKKVIVFFKFEEELYKKHGVDVEFVGHPLLESVKKTVSRDDFLKRCNLKPSAATVSLLPGSRKLEVSVLLPIMAGAAKLIKEKIPGAQFLVSKHPGIPEEFYTPVKDIPSDIKLIEGDVYNMLGASDFAIVASGTATLETAIIGTPFVITYKTHLITSLIARMVMKLKFLGIVNIIAGKEVAPEFLQFDATPAKIAEKSAEILTDKRLAQAMSKDLDFIKSSLGDPGASQRAAKAVIELI